MVLDQEIQFVHIGTQDQIADMLTKPLGDAVFAKHRRSVMNLL